ncbi:MAG TPA: ECF-type sigma factor [Phycisphaerales bacterium]|nr:ECF-type sigma factor [Phycisphaerales bacterium]
MQQSHEVTMLLEKLSAGDRSAGGQLMPLLYDELRAIAGSLFKSERAEHTLQPTALVHEAFLRLAGGGGQAGRNRAQFMAVAAKVMRQLLVDHARAQRALKRGAGQPMARNLVALEQTPSPDSLREADVLDLDEAIAELSKQYPRAADVVELRFFGGLTSVEIAKWLGISDATAERDWMLARGWLARRLGSQGGLAT